MAVEAKAEDIIKNTQVEEGNKEPVKIIEEEETNGKLNAKNEAHVSLSNEEIKVDGDKKDGEASPSYTSGNKGDSFNDQFPDLKGYEKKALTEFKSRIEEAILMNKLFEKKKKEDEPEKPKSNEQENEEEKEKKSQQEDEKSSSRDKGKAKAANDENESNQDQKVAEILENVTLWGVPLLPSRGDSATDTVLIKFLRAREFKVNDAFEMLKETLQWRKENNIDSILDEDLGNEYDDMVYMSGVDREGHPVCFNVYGIFADDDLYNRTFGTPASRDKFLRWRLRLMEKEIQKLDFSPGGVSSMLQINDLKDTPGFSRKDIRLATKQAVALLENNYPEFVARNVRNNLSLIDILDDPF